MKMNTQKDERKLQKIAIMSTLYEHVEGRTHILRAQLIDITSQTKSISGQPEQF